MKKPRLTKTQKEFLDSLQDDDVPNGYFECFAYEARTAISLQKKGLVEFEKGGEPENGCDIFMARMTEKCKKLFYF